MSLPIDIEDYNYRFYKNLNEDVQLISDDLGRWDINFDYDKEDWCNVNGFDSLINACIIAIMTRFTELGFMELYDEFGCRIHELIKENKSRDIQYRIELFVKEVLEDIRRVKKVNWIMVEDNPYNEYYNYLISFNISAMIDEDYDEDDVNESVLEGSFKL